MPPPPGEMLQATPAFEVSVPDSEMSPAAPALIATRGLLAARPPPGPPGPLAGGGCAPPGASGRPGAPLVPGGPNPPPPDVQTYSRSGSPTGDGFTAPPKLAYSHRSLPLAGS